MIVIRKATLTEAKEIGALVKLTGNDLISKGITQWPKNFYPIERIIGAIKKEEVFVTVEGKNIVGCVSLNHSFPEEYSYASWLYLDERPLAVHWLCVRPELQGKGIGKKIMNFAEQFAKKEKSKTIRLSTNNSNTSAGNIQYVKDLSI